MMTPAQLIRLIQRRRVKGVTRGFTLAEIVIASTIFVIVSLIGVTVFVNVIRIQKRISLENAIYEDGRFLMERISREIRQNTIDYEEYYRADDPDGVENGRQVGCYGQLFYNPGSDLAFGAKCNDGSPAVPGCIINKTTLDINTGENPYSSTIAGQEADDANAFCNFPDHADAAGDCATANNAALHDQSQLFLINSEGTEKIYVAYKKVNDGTTPEYAVAMLKLSGQDNDTDGVFESWGDFSLLPSPPDYSGSCQTGYDCDNPMFLDDNLTAGTAAVRYAGYVPLTPLRTNITSLKFYVSPLEDPRKAFAETNPDDGIQQQPHVTIVMTLQPAASELSNFAGDNPPTITIQSTVTSRVYNEVKSYRSQTIGGC
ncbi:MAG TPA: prepilin-type N-terminal cleavage/methylation domain-containing protein [Candidatus Gracilibacteria bacterium]|nr:prepilin-type N-terminal cleavage/methylation domain-containing protein [Candidatus Gracilibacteria bacterium]